MTRKAAFGGQQPEYSGLEPPPGSPVEKPRLVEVDSVDLVEVDLADGAVAEYRVREIRPIVEWDAVELLAATSEEILTLQTCLTYAATAPRFVVIAERVTSA